MLVMLLVRVLHVNLQRTLFFGSWVKTSHYVPNKRTGGICLGGKIAPIFYNTMEDSGALPIELDVQNMNMGDVIDIFPYEGVVRKNGEDISSFDAKQSTT